MASQFQLFRFRKFSSMFATQFLGAFNDNVFKNVLLLVLAYTATTKMGIEVSILTNLAALLFILPYFLFSSLAGQVADKYEKSALTQKIKILEIVIVVFGCIGFYFDLYWLLFVALFLLGTQSTFFGPIKYAYLPQTMHSDELVGANGLFQTGTSLAILFGMMVSGLLVQLDHATFWINSLILMVAILGYISARNIPNTPAMQPDLQINWNVFTTSWQAIKFLRSLPFLFYIIMGNSWFWFYGATFLTQTPEFSKVILQGQESVVTFMLTVFSVGVAIGSLLCKTLTKNSISLKLLPFGLMGFTLFSCDLYVTLSHFTSNGSLQAGTLYSVTELFAMSGTWRVMVDLFCIGFSGGLYLIPLYACMQAYSPVSHRARVVGANNIFNALFMVGSAIFSIVMLSVLKFDIPTLFLVTAMLNIVFGLLLFTKLKKHQGSMEIHTLD